MNQDLKTQYSPESKLRANPVRILSDENLKMSFISGMHTAFTRNGKQSQTQLTSSRFDHRLNQFICNLPRSGTQKSPVKSRGISLLFTRQYARSGDLAAASKRVILE
jgi:hypothetical protein